LKLRTPAGSVYVPTRVAFTPKGGCPLKLIGVDVVAGA